MAKSDIQPGDRETMRETAIETTLKRFWRAHRCLTAAGQAETAAMLVEVAVEYAYTAGLTAAVRHNELAAPDISAEAAKILGTLREAERYGRDERFSAESFKALLRLIYRKGIRATEHSGRHGETGGTPGETRGQNDKRPGRC